MLIKKENIQAAKFLSSLNSGDTEGSVWDVTIIEAGFAAAKPHVMIPTAALQSSQSVFNGSRVFFNRESDYFGHKLDASKKSGRDVVGWLDNGHIEGGELKASLHILPSAAWFKDDLNYLRANNQLNLFQLSIDGGYYTDGTQYVPDVKENVPIVAGFAGGDVDIVPRGAAGGKINRMVASENHTQNNNTQGVSMDIKKKLMTLFALVYPALFASSNVDWLKVNENEMYSHLLAADKPQGKFASLPEGFDEATVVPVIDGLIEKYSKGIEVVTPAAAPIKAAFDEKEIRNLLTAQATEMTALRLIACSSQLTSALQEAKLPEHANKILASKYQGKTFTPDELAADIKAVREVIAPFTAKQNDSRFDVHIDAAEEDKIQASLDLMFATSGTTIKPIKAGSDEYIKMAKLGNGQVTPFRSIKEAYILVTGDKELSGRIKERSRMLASLDTTSWANVLANTLNRQLVKDYNYLNLDTWRDIVDVVDVKDFRPQVRVRFGGYGTLDTVPQGGPYLGLTSPTDESMNYTPTKRGGTEDVTLEMIKNDDVGAITKIPTRMARAAGRTLHHFVYDFLKPSINPVIYDSVALYIAAHSNIGTAALDLAGLKAARVRMVSQTELNSMEPLGIELGFVLVPAALEETAFELSTGKFGVYYKEEETFLHTLGLKPIRVDYWTDATDWVAVAKRESGVGLEIGFLDGQQTPELLVSDMPNVGSWFTNDKLTYKIRHIYGGGITDYRFFDGSVVAG